MRVRLWAVAIAVAMAACGDDDGAADAALGDGALADASSDAAALDAGFDAGGPGPVSVTMQHNDLARTGANLAETQLDTSNVTAARFGKLFTRAVDDEIYAQPLVVGGLAIGGRTRNVVYVATVNDTLYAFDADDPAAAAPLWQVSLLPAGARPAQATDVTAQCNGHAYTDFNDHMGIVGTPVIDPQAGTLYVVARSVEGTETVQRLHALALTTGSERPGSPVRIEVPAAPGRPAFDPLHQNQRAGLLLVDGTVYVAWAGHCIWSPYHGWLIGYDARTLAQTAVYVTTPSGDLGGIWMSGQGPAADADGIYVATGNGDVGVPGDPTSLANRGESILRLRPADLQVQSYFTPSNWSFLNDSDRDVGASGPMLVPGTTLLVSGSKQGEIFVLDRRDLGGLGPANDPQIVQHLRDDFNQGMFGSAVFWRGPGGGTIYVWLIGSPLRAYRLDAAGARFQTPPFASNATALPVFPGAQLAISAHGAAAGTGILWATHGLAGADAGHRPGILHAFDAADPTRELWSSDVNPTRDAPGLYAKFAYPTIANGKVYLATFSHVLVVYGLL